MNNIALLGRLVRKPEVSTTQSGASICKFTLAVNRKFKKDECDFINCVAFGKTGENIEQYTDKGNQLAVNGALQINSYEKDGTRVYTHSVVVDSFDFVSAPKKSETTAPANDDWDMTPIGDGDIPF